MRRNRDCALRFLQVKEGKQAPVREYVSIEMGASRRSGGCLRRIFGCWGDGKILIRTMGYGLMVFDPIIPVQKDLQLLEYRSYNKALDDALQALL